MHEAFLQEGRQTHRDRLLLSAAVSAGKATIDAAYEVAEIHRYLDWIALMTYDLHGAWDHKTGINAPFISGDSLNVQWAANYWMDNGCPSRKLVLGMAFYGRSFILSDKRQHGVGAPITGCGNKGPLLEAKAVFSYQEICKKFVFGGGTKKWYEEQRCPYAYKGSEWVGYDNEYSLGEKVNWLKEAGLGGFMAWMLHMDDFNGKFCKAGRFPLLKTLNRVLYPTVVIATGPEVNYGVNNVAQNEGEMSTSTTAPAGDGVCAVRADGLYQDPADCGFREHFIWVTHSIAATLASTVLRAFSHVG
ncbi:Acidic mammalian chitinase [Lamellibrachia satsuma]|nr:Acidic mammalian chitinase [Lamellibrachia satsuma]